MSYDDEPRLAYWPRGEDVPGTGGPVVEDPPRHSWRVKTLAVVGVLAVAVPWWIGVLYLLDLV